MKSRLNAIKDWATLAREANYKVGPLAKRCGVSARQLQRHFRQTWGKTPHERMRELRNVEALSGCDGSKNLKEIAELAGYSNEAHFSREFKKVYGMCPRDAAYGG